MSEDEAGLLKQHSKKQQQQQVVCGSKVEEEETKKRTEALGALPAAAETAAAETAAAAEAPLPQQQQQQQPPAAAAAPSSPPRAPEQDRTGGATEEQQEQQQGGLPIPPPPPPLPLPPLNPAAAAAAAAARAPSSSPDFVCCDPAVPAYVERHSRVAARLAEAMDRGPRDNSRRAKEAHDAELLELIGECGAAVRALRDARCAALDAGRVAEVAAGAFVHPGQRLLAWMGGIRPSDYLSCARAMLAVWGEELSPEAASALSQLQAAVAEQQQSMTAAFTELSERLARTAAVARYVRASCAAKEEEEWGAAGEGEGEE